MIIALYAFLYPTIWKLVMKSLESHWWKRPRPSNFDHLTLRAALHIEAGQIPLEANCMKFQPFRVGDQPQLHIIVRL
jgi:hypothetical protein